ncbi:hypothetical protein H072_7485 [Dactylellina haptotyla CBS 200.50]|uniref:Uncharacterized protein n=1 Tax=Dactylellina haptotyla (strain CBS 200.50) TaxID=1284197 RepID=S8A6Z4_DACHA|nr:hypothetical protein H072_7485 [Dactylellina haptotyla CBS 200.50]
MRFSISLSFLLPVFTLTTIITTPSTCLSLNPLSYFKRAKNYAYPPYTLVAVGGNGYTTTLTVTYTTIVQWPIPTHGNPPSSSSILTRWKTVTKYKTLTRTVTTQKWRTVTKYVTRVKTQTQKEVSTVTVTVTDGANVSTMPTSTMSASTMSTSTISTSTTTEASTEAEAVSRVAFVPVGNAAKGWSQY